MKIEHLISIDRAILMVYYTNTSTYQYAIAFDNNSIYIPNELYYTADKALKVGRERIKIMIGI
ncbi:hypothetical protein STA3757_09130 [Stanieria sp. NIES-3757]|nr:hypothetical protein STA3757_09130 [Stanieria sp. NIES-3757]